MRKAVIFIVLLLVFQTACKANVKTTSSGNEASYSFQTDSYNTGLSSDNASIPANITQTPSSAAISSTGFDWGSAGSNALLLQYPSHGSMTNSRTPVFKWSSIKAQSYTFFLEEKSGSAYSQVKKVEKLNANEYKTDMNLKSNTTYRWRVEAIMDGNAVKHYGSTLGGAVFLTTVDPKTNPANIGKDFAFDGKISEQVLKNYLSRSKNISIVSNPSEDPESDKRMILSTGVKYIYRANMAWQAETEYINSIAKYKQIIDSYHSIDPDIIFESNILETVNISCEQTPIPDWVFKAFNQTVEKRNFSYSKMIFLNGKYLDYWGKNFSVPDITRVETQMYQYYRACRYMDAGFESIHWCQIHLVGADDVGFKEYTKVISMVREYGKTHSRRHFVLQTASTQGIMGYDGKLLLDFHTYPTRGYAPDGEVNHAPTEANPQKIIFKVGYLDSIYQKSLGGMTYSGWSCKYLPYIVELDNNWVDDKEFLNVAHVPDGHWATYGLWGMDDISWFANQPASYRHAWLKYASDWFKSNDPAGAMCMPGNRPAYMQNIDKLVWYYANSKEFSSFGWGDEDAIKGIWIAENGK